MTDQDGFFGSIFGSAEEDPLLQSDADALDANGDGASSQTAPPPSSAPPSSSPQNSASQKSASRGNSATGSAATGSSPPNGSARDSSPADHSPSPSSAAGSSPRSNGDAAEASEDAMEVREVTLHQCDDGTEGLDTLNEAVEDGWRLSHISVEDRVNSVAGDVETKLTVLLERNTPRSLFDFGNSY